ncbi:MAG: hypothetical protein A2283_21270 [Lentisphaerae bacterium RIFOXYA12_FULL_48_11]|nr:MAG: hypothetical protein A2283_21270 [Lentisphaerae bacterium RIFOXYA12_FULL_48_11]
MRIRDHLAKKRRIVFLTAFVCWLVFGIAGFMGSPSKHTGMPPLMLLAFAGFMGCVFFMLFGLRCPNCKNNLGYAIQWPTSFWGISDKLKFCPFCGVELDKEMKDLRTRPSSLSETRGGPPQADG